MAAPSVSKIFVLNHCHCLPELRDKWHYVGQNVRNGKVFRDLDVHVIISSTFIWAKKIKYRFFFTPPPPKKKTKKLAKKSGGDTEQNSKFQI